MQVWAAREAALRADASFTVHWPVVTVSREFGTTGAQIGEHLADLLGFAFWDRRVIEAIANRINTSVTELDAVDERAPGALEEFIAMVLRINEVPSRAFHDALRGLVRTLERRGSAVIVGRGAGFIVRPDRALRVRITAPLGHRIEQHAKTHGLDASTARDQVVRVDRERQAYVQQRFDANADDPLHYDFVLNVGNLPVARSAELLREVYRTKFGSLPELGAVTRPRTAGQTPG